jgi:hypothetical protein
MRPLLHELEGIIEDSLRDGFLPIAHEIVDEFGDGAAPIRRIRRDNPA